MTRLLHYLIVNRYVQTHGENNFPEDFFHSKQNYKYSLRDSQTDSKTVSDKKQNHKTVIETGRQIVRK